MTFILLKGSLLASWLALAPATARACADRLDPGLSEVVLRGVLRESTRSTTGPTWSVWMEDADEHLVLSAGDRVRLLDVTGNKITDGGTLEFVRRVFGWNVGPGPRALPLRTPRLRRADGSIVPPEVIRDAIRSDLPIAVVKTVDETKRRLLAPGERRRVEIVPGVALGLRPDEIVIVGEPRVTFDDEMRHVIDYTATGWAPPRLHQGLRLAVGDESRGFAPVRSGDLVLLVDAEERVLAKSRRLDVEAKWLWPFTDEQRAWAEALARARRVVIVRRK